MAVAGATGEGRDWQGMHERLVRDEARTVEQVSALSRLVEDIVAAAAGVATDDEHDPEGHTIAFERAQAGALLAQARDRRDDIRAALGRLRSGGYGLCERCGQPIAVERLEARPAARTCVACASRRY